MGDVIEQAAEVIAEGYLYEVPRWQANGLALALAEAGLLRSDAVLDAAVGIVEAWEAWVRTGHRTRHNILIGAMPGLRDAVAALRAARKETP